MIANLDRRGNKRKNKLRGTNCTIARKFEKRGESKRKKQIFGLIVNQTLTARMSVYCVA